MPIEAIIFDLDNTLVNRRDAFKRYSERFIEQFVAATGRQQISEIMDYIYPCSGKSNGVVLKVCFNKLCFVRTSLDDAVCLELLPVS